MASAIAQLQADALNRSVSLPDMLRKGYVIARKLGLDELATWANAELSGYTCLEKELPEYRFVSGEVRAWNPFHGWQRL